MITKFISYLGLIFLLLCQGLAYGQESFVRILDSKTKKPISYAHVELVDMINNQKSYQVTDDYGKILNTAEHKSILRASFVGYDHLVDTILPNQNYSLHMKAGMHVLEEVVVTGQYAPERTDKSVYQIQVIDNKQIQAKASQNLQDALSSSLNFRFSNGGALGTRALLQGIGGENIKILVDGVPQIGRLNGDLDLGQIDINNVQRIEIVEGPMSVQYGTNALAGVINIITKDFISNRFAGKLNTYYESVGQYNVDGSLGYYKNKKTYLFNFSRKYFNGFSTKDTARVDQWKPKRSYDLDFKYKRRIGTANLRFQAAYYNEKLLDKGTPQYIAFPQQKAYFPIARDGYFLTQRFKSNLSFDGVVGKNNYLNLLASYTHYNRQKEYYIKNLTTENKELSSEPADLDTTKINSWVFRGTWSKFDDKDRKFNFQLGYDVNLESMLGNKIEAKKQAINDYALFASVKYHPAKWFEVQPGLRAAYNSEYKAPVTPSVNFLFNPLNNGSLIFRASYANGFRAPSIKELYLEFVDVNHNIYGNPNLTAETSHSIRMNMIYSYKSSNKVVFKTENYFFYNDIRNKISLLSYLNKENPNDTKYMYNNIDQFKSVGGGITLTYRLHENFDLKVGASVTGLNQTLSDGVKSNAYYFYPESTFNLIYSLIPIRTEFNVNYKYTGQIQNIAVDVNGELSKYKQQDYHTLDVSAKRSFFNDHLSLTIGGKNLFNVTTINGANQVGGVHMGGSAQVPIMWGRSFFAALSYRFNR
ncbi:MAG: TonB-dependent receptor plug domain-containing protein [Bacteroidales bacterium]